MAGNVFGLPITNSFLKGEYPGKNNFTRSDRAQAARRMKDDPNRAPGARQFVENLKADFGDGVSTLCLLYNASGEPVRFVAHHDWYGHIGRSPCPLEIANGQWGAFLHVKTCVLPTGSTGAVVYRGLDNAGQYCDWIVAWDTPFIRVQATNHVYTEIRDVRFDGSVWDTVEDKMRMPTSHSRGTWNGCCSTVTIGGNASPVLEAVLEFN